MDAERRHQATELVMTLRELPAEERPTELQRLCAGDSDLRREVEELLGEPGPSERPPDTVPPPLAERPPARIGKYEIVGRIGKGGFGEVFLGRDSVIKREVAIKLCTSGHEKLRQRFTREVEITGGLQHPNITTVHDSGSFEGIPYLVQEYLPGEDLAQQIRTRRETTPAERLRYLIQVARGLSYAHGRGVIHRDVKPSNVRVLDDGTVKILDFGIARLLDDAKTQLTQTGMRVGTMCYMAPEQLRGEKVDPRADIFSFGILAYELLTYRHPFKAESSHQVMYRVLESEPTPIEDLWSGCPPRLAACVKRCLAKKADQRFGDMIEVLSELESVAVEESGMAGAMTTIPTTATSVRAAELPSGRGRRPRLGPRRGRLLAGAAVVLAALSLAYVVGRGGVAPEPKAEEPKPPASPEQAPPATTSSAPAPETTDSVRPPETTSSVRPPATTTSVRPPATTTSARPLPPPASAAVASELVVGTRAEPPPAAPELVAEPSGEVKRDLPVTKVPPPAAPPPPVEGRVKVTALPWAMVESLTSAAGQEVELAAHYTPFAAKIPVGVYTLVLSDPGSGGTRRCRLEVRADAVGECRERFSRIRAEDFFAVYEPDGGTGRPPPRPPPGRPPPREGPPRREGPVPRKIPDWLTKGAQAYFDGDYASVQGILEAGSKNVKEEREAFYAYLFRGAALHALYLLGGETDEALATQAAKDLTMCRKARSPFSPNSAHFSPRFIEFYSIALVRAGS